jgi:transforming growth factor-beta-induced protein
MAPTAALIGSGALALFLAGCGDSGDDVTQNIGEIAGGAKELSTLVTALNATDLVGAVSDTKDITVFAPTNDAFAALPKKVFDCLLQPVGLPTLKEVLEYHVVTAKALSTDLKNNEILATLDGKQTLTVMLDGKTVTIDAGGDAANVTKADIKATNGVVHEINAVLLPKDFVAPECGSGTIADTAVGNKDLSTLVTALSDAGLVDTFKGTTLYTVFAPTNEAFAAVDPDLLACLLLPANKDALTQVLTYHVVAGYDLASDITDGLKVPTLEKQDLTFNIAKGVVIETTSGGKATVTIPNVYATNGVVHVIDAVMIPTDFVAPTGAACSKDYVADAAILV